MTDDWGHPGSFTHPSPHTDRQTDTHLPNTHTDLGTLHVIAAFIFLDGRLAVGTGFGVAE